MGFLPHLVGGKQQQQQKKKKKATKTTTITTTTTTEQRQLMVRSSSKKSSSSASTSSSPAVSPVNSNNNNKTGTSVTASSNTTSNVVNPPSKQPQPQQQQRKGSGLFRNSLLRRVSSSTTNAAAASRFRRGSSRNNNNNNNVTRSSITSAAAKKAGAVGGTTNTSITTTTGGTAAVLNNNSHGKIAPLLEEGQYNNNSAIATTTTTTSASRVSVLSSLRVLPTKSISTTTGGGAADDTSSTSYYLNESSEAYDEIEALYSDNHHQHNHHMDDDADDQYHPSPRRTLRYDEYDRNHGNIEHDGDDDDGNNESFEIVMSQVDTPVTSNRTRQLLQQLQAKLEAADAEAAEVQQQSQAQQQQQQQRQMTSSSTTRANGIPSHGTLVEPKSAISTVASLLDVDVGDDDDDDEDEDDDDDDDEPFDIKADVVQLYEKALNHSAHLDEDPTMAESDESEREWKASTLLLSKQQHSYLQESHPATLLEQQQQQQQTEEEVSSKELQHEPAPPHPNFVTPDNAMTDPNSNPQKNQQAPVKEQLLPAAVSSSFPPTPGLYFNKSLLSDSPTSQSVRRRLIDAFNCVTPSSTAGGAAAIDDTVTTSIVSATGTTVPLGHLSSPSAQRQYQHHHQRKIPMMDFFYDHVCGAPDPSNFMTNKKRPFYHEQFALEFLRKMMFEGFPLLYLQPVSSSFTASSRSTLSPEDEKEDDWTGESVTMTIQQGSLASSLRFPRLEWSTWGGGWARPEVRTTSLDLLQIHSILDHESVMDTTNNNYRNTNLNNNNMDHPNSDNSGGGAREQPQDVYAFTVTSEQGDVHIFEASSQNERDQVVCGLRNVVARLSYQLVSGDDHDLGLELFRTPDDDDDDDDSDSVRMYLRQNRNRAELPPLVTPKHALQHMTHEFLDS